MLNSTRVRFNAWMQRVATLNGVDDATKSFNVEPSVEQKLEQTVQESSEFLSQINTYGVQELAGEKIGMNVTKRIASRTDTSGGKRRSPNDPTGLVGRGYQLTKTNFDTYMGYNKLDQWAKFPNFQAMANTMIAQAIALDRICIGWNGTSVAVDTDPADELLSDVNKGWLQYIREEADKRVFSEGAVEAGKIIVGPDPATSDYRTLDALVYDAVHSHMPTWGRKRNDLIAITSEEMLHDKYFPLINTKEDPTEQLARDIIMSSKRLGGRQAAAVPYFIDNALLITAPKNLSIYYQEGKRRRHIREEPDYDRVADYQSSNEGYALEDLDIACLIENVEIREE